MRSFSILLERVEEFWNLYRLELKCHHAGETSKIA